MPSMRRAGSLVVERLRLGREDGAHHAELVAHGVAHDHPALALRRADADRAKGKSDARRASGLREAVAEQCEGDAQLVAKTVANGEHANATHKPDDGCTGRCVAHALRNRKGADRECALTTATELGWIEIRDGRYFRGESWPSAA